MKSNQQLVGLTFMVLGLLAAIVIGKTLGGLVGWVGSNGWVAIHDAQLLGPDFTVTALVGIVIAGALTFRIYRNAEAQVVANETASELRKVTWPQFTPLFSMETEVWVGSVVVVVSVIVMSMVLFGLDSLWSWLTGLIY